MTSVSSSGADLLASIQQNLFKKIDTNGDGSVSKQEFVVARPKNVSESQATALYNKIDTSGSDALTQDQLVAGMKANRPQGASSSDPSSTNPLSDSMVSLIQQLLQSLGQDDQKNGSSSNSSAIAGIGQTPTTAADIFSKIDTNGDGSVTQAEFVAARPAGISEDQATATFKSIDTAGTGSINEQQFADRLNGANQTAAGGPLPGGHHHHHHHASATDDSDSDTSTTNSLLSALSDSSTSDSSGTSSEDDMLATILKAIKSYGSGAASASTAGLTSTLLDI